MQAKKQTIPQSFQRYYVSVFSFTKLFNCVNSMSGCEFCFHYRQEMKISNLFMRFAPKPALTPFIPVEIRTPFITLAEARELALNKHRARNRCRAQKHLRFGAGAFQNRARLKLWAYFFHRETRNWRRGLWIIPAFSLCGGKIYARLFIWQNLIWSAGFVYRALGERATRRWEQLFNCSWKFAVTRKRRLHLPSPALTSRERARAC